MATRIHVATCSNKNAVYPTAVMTVNTIHDVDIVLSSPHFHLREKEV